jgi:hypothetical protein
LKVNIPYRGSQGPLHLLIDSTGIKVEGEREWNARKHGGAKRHMWRKTHTGIDKKTLEIRAAEFTSSGVNPSWVVEVWDVESREAVRIDTEEAEDPAAQGEVGLTLPTEDNFAVRHLASVGSPKVWVVNLRT